MSMEEFAKILNGYKRKARIDMPIVPLPEKQDGMFVAIAPGFKFTGNPVTGAITVNWGVGYMTKRPNHSAIAVRGKAV